MIGPLVRVRLQADLPGCVAALHTHTTRADWTAPDGGPVHLRRYAR